MGTRNGESAEASGFSRTAPRWGELYITAGGSSGPQIRVGPCGDSEPQVPF